jgi:hypothetical protein
MVNMHNMYLEEDGINDAWEEGVQSDWQGELGEQEVCLDYSGMGLCSDVNIDNENDTEVLLDPNVIDGVHVTRVRNCSNKFSEKKL